MNKKQKKANPAESRATIKATNKLLRVVKKCQEEYDPTSKGYVYEGYRYKSNGKADPKTGWKPLKCSRSGKTHNKCTAGIKYKDGIFVPGKKPHNHSPDVDLEYVKRFKKALFAFVTAPTRINDLKFAYETTSARYIRASVRWPYKTVCRTLFRWRSTVLGKGLIPSQKSIDDFLAQLGTEDGLKMRTFKIGGGEDDEEQEIVVDYAPIKCGHATHIVFYDPTFVEKMKDAKVWNIDATYKTALKYTKNTQLLTVMGRSSGKPLPFLWVLMPRRTARDYKAVFKHIKEKFPFLQPDTVICDFEKALEKALREVFNCKVQGCYFHHAQCIFRQAVKKKFVARRKSEEKNPEKRKYLNKIIALALLPALEIQPMFNKLEEEILKKFNCPSTIRFLNYYRSTWINGFKPAAYSVYGTTIRTKNCIEAYHRQINKYAKVNKVTENSFLGMLTDLCRNNQSIMNSLNAGNEEGTKSNRMLFLVREAALLHAWELYSNPDEKDYTIEKLFDVCCKLVSNFIDDFEFTVIETETERDVQNYVSCLLENEGKGEEDDGKGNFLDPEKIEEEIDSSDDEELLDDDVSDSGEDEFDLAHWDGEKLELEDSSCDEEEVATNKSVKSSKATYPAKSDTEKKAVIEDAVEKKLEENLDVQSVEEIREIVVEQDVQIESYQYEVVVEESEIVDYEVTETSIIDVDIIITEHNYAALHKKKDEEIIISKEIQAAIAHSSIEINHIDLQPLQHTRSSKK